MRHSILFSILLLSSLSMVTVAYAGKPVKKVATDSGYTIRGTVSGLQGYIYLQSFSNNVKKDSTLVTGGKFVLNGKVPEPTRCFITNSDKSFFTILYVENSVISLTGSKEGRLNITGSKTHDEYRYYMAMQKASNDRLAQLEPQLQAAKKSNNQNEIISIGKEWTALSAQKEEVMMTYIAKHPSSYVAADMLCPLIYNMAYAESILTPLVAKLSPAIRQSAVGKDITARMDRRFPKAEYAAPDFTLPSIDGKQVSLSSYRGKWLLLDFWASWCAPCRAENPNVLKAYKIYHPKGLEILAVSLDNGKPAWEQAVKKDGLPWTQVSDLKGWGSAPAKLYKVNGIPSNFLINPQGIVVATNLRGYALEDKLSMILK
jgi:peroxiredoxin